ncbi:MAG: hypothetical protein CEN90_651 [Parcubacteria group bacterium Licking1014_17]|nr:MAG: hypothetical protein CEN90_651 [Parcubacteria group bacterium Licking1014_17]
MNEYEKPEQEDEGFVKNELEKLRAINDRECESLATFLQSHIDEIYRLLIERNKGSADFEGLCEVAAEELHKRLKAAGYDSKMVEGDLVVGEKDSLSHMINMVKFPNHWVLIDLTIRQLPWYKNKSWLLEALPPDNAEIKKFLYDRYNWWLGPNHDYKREPFVNCKS